MSVRLKSALLAAGLALVASGAEATILNGGFDSGLGNWTTQNVQSENSNTYSGAKAAKLNPTSQPAILSQVLASSFNGMISFYYDITGGSLIFSAGAYSVSLPAVSGYQQFTTPLLNLAAGSTITFTYTGATSSQKGYIDQVSTAAVPVPGPIAGAGLPILVGVAGYAAWRRRKARNAA